MRVLTFAECGIAAKMNRCARQIIGQKSMEFGKYVESIAKIVANFDLNIAKFVFLALGFHQRMAS